MLVVSIDRIGSYSHNVSRTESALVLEEFFDSWDVGLRLARARQLLSAPFSTKVGADGKDELERELESTPHWSATQRNPPAAEKLSQTRPDEER